MILIIAVLAILLLIVSSILWHVNNERNFLVQQLQDEQEAKAKLLKKEVPEPSEIETGTLVKQK